MNLRVAIAALIAATSVSARAEQPYYYQRTGVQRDTFRSDKVECETLAAGAKVGSSYQPSSPNIYAAGAGAFAAGMMRSAERRRIRETGERRCMADKGYARIATDAKTIRSVGHLKGEARVDRMAMMAAAEPEGERLPE